MIIYRFDVIASGKKNQRKYLISDEKCVSQFRFALWMQKRGVGEKFIGKKVDKKTKQQKAKQTVKGRNNSCTVMHKHVKKG